jgi:hypothetical protein
MFIIGNVSWGGAHGLQSSEAQGVVMVALDTVLTWYAHSKVVILIMVSKYIVIIGCWRALDLFRSGP